MRGRLRTFCFAKTRWLWPTLLAMTLWCGGERTAAAIPAFARTYGLSCSTCHVGGPRKLSPFGEAFRNAGYHIPGESAEFQREAPLPLGQTRRSELPGAWRSQIWPGEIPGQLPLAVIGELGVDLTKPQGDLAPPSTLDYTAKAGLVLGGSLGRHFGFFGEVEASNHGFELEQIFGSAQSLFERWLGESALNIKVGYFTPDLFAVMPRLQRSRFVALPLSLALGRDHFSLERQTPALELYGLLGGRLKWVVGVVNGIKPTDDVTTRRDFVGRLQLKLGGPRLDYKQATSADTAPTLSLGVFTYVGVSVNVPSPPETRFPSELYRLGFDARFRVHGLDVLGQVVLGQDSDPDGLGDSVRHISYAIGVEYPVLPWLQPLVRYEEAFIDSGRHPNRRRLVLGLQTFVRANISVLAEGAIGLLSSEAHLLSGNILFAM